MRSRSWPSAYLHRSRGAALVAFGVPFEVYKHRMTGSALSELDPEAQEVTVGLCAHEEDSRHCLLWYCEKEYLQPRCALQALDVDKSGTVTLDELREGLAKQGSPITQKEVEALMESIDVDATGSIDYDEFLAATMNMSQLQASSHQQPHH